MEGFLTIHTQLLDELEVNGVQNGIILSNVGDIILKLRGDIHWLRCYMGDDDDLLFDKVYSVHDTIVQLQSIILNDA